MRESGSVGRRALLAGAAMALLPFDADAEDATLLSGTINDRMRVAVTSGLKLIPGPGDLLATFVALLWPPSADDVWSEIREAVEALIDQKLNAATLADVNATLLGLKSVSEDYRTNVKGNRSQANTAYTAAEAAFDAAKPHFIAIKGSELLLVGLTANMANLHLAVLRDGVLFGDKWGRDAQWRKQKQQKLAAQITEYVTFARTWVINGRISAGPLPKFEQKDLDIELYGELISRAEHDALVPLAWSRHRARTWSFCNRYVREMTRSVLDHALLWPSFDPTSSAAKHPPSVTREIFSSIYGIPLPSSVIAALPTPAKPLSDVTVFAGAGVSAVQAGYGGVPGPRMGRGDGAVPAAWNPPIAAGNPITVVDGRADIGLDQLQFTFKDGSKTPAAGSATDGKPFDSHFTGHALSSIRVLGASDRAATADCVILGFRPINTLDQPPPPLTRVPPVGNFSAGLTLFDFYDPALAVRTLWVYADGDKIRGLAWQYPLGDRFSVGDVGGDPQHLPNIVFAPDETIRVLTISDSTYGYGSARRVEIATTTQHFVAGAAGGRPTTPTVGGQRIVGFFGTVNPDNFINGLGIYLR
jgi:hypothetical protein